MSFNASFYSFLCFIIHVFYGQCIMLQRSYLWYQCLHLFSVLSMFHLTYGLSVSMYYASWTSFFNGICFYGRFISINGLLLFNASESRICFNGQYASSINVFYGFSASSRISCINLYYGFHLLLLMVSNERVYLSNVSICHQCSQWFQCSASSICSVSMSASMSMSICVFLSNLWF